MNPFFIRDDTGTLLGGDPRGEALFTLSESPYTGHYEVTVENPQDPDPLIRGRRIRFKSVRKDKGMQAGESFEGTQFEEPLSSFPVGVQDTLRERLKAETKV